MHQSPGAVVDRLFTHVVEGYSVVLVVFELWLVLWDLAPNFPALVLFYDDIVGQLGMEELKELVERQVVIPPWLLIYFTDL